MLGVDVPHKVRINSSISSDVLAAMDSMSMRLDCSRSEIIEYAFRFWMAAYKASEGSTNYGA